MPKIKHGNVVLCEYVSQGAGNKPILINVFSGDIIVSQLPADLSIGLFMELTAGQNISSLTIEMAFDKKTLVRAEMLVVGNPMLTGGALVIPQVPVRIERDGIFEITASAKGFTPTVVVSKRIFQGAVPGVTSPTASPPPS